MNHPRRAGALRAARLAAFLASLAFAPACALHAERAAKSATNGMVDKAREKLDVPADEHISTVVGARAVEGALRAIDSPEQRKRIKQLVDSAVTQAVSSALRAALAPPPKAARGSGPLGGVGPGEIAVLADQVGRAATDGALARVADQLGGDGALRRGIVTTSAIATDAAVMAAISEMFPGCRGDDAAAVECRREQLQALTRTAAANVTAGVRDAIGWQLLLIAALVGVTAGVLGHWLITQRRRSPRALRHV